MGEYLLVFVLATFAFAAAELPDNEAGYGVYKIQQKSDCPTVYCPSNCQRYIDTNGCLFCGACKQKTTCPLVTCPNLPYFQCVARAGQDGCTICKCRVKPKSLCATPMCSQNCHLAAGSNGCPVCVCPRRVDCPRHLQENVPCERSECWKERGADGCYHCRCPDDVDVCPEVPCDTDKCTHVINHNTGCPVECRCNHNDI